MNIRKKIILCILVYLFFISCVSPNESLKLSPAEGSVVWIDGKEFIEKISNKVKIRIAFDHIDGTNLAFRVSVINSSRSDILFDPAESSYICVNLNHELKNENKNKNSPESIKAVDPETIMNNLNQTKTKMIKLNNIPEDIKIDFNNKIAYLEKQLMRKNTIEPEKSKDGLIFFPMKSKKLMNIILKIPVNKSFVDFKFDCINVK